MTRLSNQIREGFKSRTESDSKGFPRRSGSPCFHEDSKVHTRTEAEAEAKKKMVEFKVLLEQPLLSFLVPTSPGSWKWKAISSLKNLLRRLGLYPVIKSGLLSSSASEAADQLYFLKK